MGFSNLILDKIKLDVADILIAGGFSFDVLEVVEGKVSTPSAGIVGIRLGGGGSETFDSDPEDYTQRTGSSVSRWAVDIFVGSDAPDRALGDALDDLRNAIERPASNVQALNIGGQGTVRDAIVITGDTVEGGETGDQTITGKATAIVEVRYEYTRGNL